MLLDIHSHILPNVDDGAKDLETAITLLKLMQKQGITTVIATPHFYPHDDTIEAFKNRRNASYELLRKQTDKLPNIILGCELFYFSGITRSEFMKEFTIGKSNYLLLEPNPYMLSKGFMNEILYLKNELGIIPIIAHVERYHTCKSYRAFLKFIKENGILTQVNAASFFSKSYNRVLKKLFKDKIITFIATDTHSLRRPPMMDIALSEIENRFGLTEVKRIIYNLETLYNNITVEAANDEIKHPKYL